MTCHFRLASRLTFRRFRRLGRVCQVSARDRSTCALPAARLGGLVAATAPHRNPHAPFLHTFPMYSCAFCSPDSLAPPRLPPLAAGAGAGAGAARAALLPLMAAAQRLGVGLAQRRHHNHYRRATPESQQQQQQPQPSSSSSGSGSGGGSGSGSGRRSSERACARAQAYGQASVRRAVYVFVVLTF